MSTEENKTIVRRFVDAVWNRANLAAADELLAEDALANGRVVGPQAVREATRRNAVARPDLSYIIEDLIAEGDRVVVRWTGRGTHLGDWDHPVFGHHAPTGQVVTSTGVNIFRLAGGKIVERWDVRDELGVGRQLGNILPPDYSPAVLEANKAVVRRLYDAVYNRTNPAAAHDLIAEDVLGNGRPFGGPQAVLDNVASLVAARPDLHYTINTLVAEGDLVVVRWTSHGTLREGFNHPLFGHVSSTGQVLEETGINIHRIVNGKVVETWGMKDSVHLGQQLGVMPSPGQPPA